MTLSTQFITMLAMIGMGSFFGAALDTYNRFLKRSNRKSWIVFINDILFWVVQGLAIFYILFIVNRGELRFYIFIALLCGFAAYQSLFKGLYLRLLEIVISLIVAIYRFVLKLFHYMIYKPIRGLILAVIYFLLMIKKGLFALLKLIFKIIIVICKVILLPFKWLLLLLWKVLPKGLKKSVEKIYNRMAGVSKKIKNNITKWITILKKYKK
ncbi:spore cortex biosynthesis protein YabQ [Bacillus sp. DTU_2020_1000418_1_SI_GHA_SEK_038]|uniref:spore cortex biosynthesis protein YabQ n=1 Tax=Bacillus sp. DTU_2020_1000418_1_SI_GHA_SEK_038 TaxID=3077585 RepID=UPI0028E7A4DA|nr:spore cortex biosynthesis protein YabQ [Bacillus sp. DTU_2020_1000418_1_SI_GHA_SEK_038]WNS75557.1 spore cortex biosynthesis protein YabQ [Bacillus sp. DTU_2020_1000418_1_SI_GHA_SEK_038]